MSFSRKQHKMRIRWHSLLFLWGGTAVILLGGAFTLFWQMQHGAPMKASGSSVIGPPTLSAETVETIFRRNGSPMVGTGQAVVEAASQYNIDDAFALAVWWAETNQGAAGVGLADLNPGSVRGNPGYPTAYDGYTLYPSYTEAVWDWFKLIRNGYVDRGTATVYDISSTYVGTADAPEWAAKVMEQMSQYRAEAPAPIPSPTPSSEPTQEPTPTATPIKTPSSQPTVVSTKSARQTKQEVPTTKKQPEVQPQAPFVFSPQFFWLTGGGLALVCILVPVIVTQIKRRRQRRLMIDLLLGMTEPLPDNMAMKKLPVTPLPQTDFTALPFLQESPVTEKQLAVRPPLLKLAVRKQEVQERQTDALERLPAHGGLLSRYRSGTEQLSPAIEKADEVVTLIDPFEYSPVENLQEQKGPPEAGTRRSFRRYRMNTIKES
ncbi:mannosyl-glycoprotein endo-beta-N-acetylglucosaminidase [Thermosporothrix hazakensis]|jgi:hypothetical protein|uniref:Mannosyl-glycoprotein endo-beta-N-acetylglucosaminidase n=2 Tax=Thermosporothrix hazakensis TaxID=644383 RepID=A0A326TZJ2_THEHA|nr:mannosyl-glycoprotein endo-beta-N-acetylglucosaminidase [Thermosporothrix hazakensis]